MKFEMQGKVYVILVNYNNTKDTVECIESIKNETRMNAQIIVVDNASTTGNIEEIKNEHSDVILIKNDANVGFAIANNIGIEYALENGADYILLLNNDTIVKPNFCSNLISVLEEQGIDILTCKIRYYTEQDKIWYSGGEISFKKGYGYHYTDERLKKDVNEITFISGCCLLARRAVFEKQKLPTEYFMYFEDVDFSIQLHEGGYKLYYTPLVEIYHKVSASAGVESPFFIYYWNRNRIIFLKKYKKKIGFMYYHGMIKLVLTRIIKYMIYTIHGLVEERNCMIRGTKDGCKYKSMFCEED